MAPGNSQTTASPLDIPNNTPSIEPAPEESPFSDDARHNSSQLQPQIEHAPPAGPSAKELEAREAQARRERHEALNRSRHLNVPRRERDPSPAASSIVSASSTGSVDTTDMQQVDDEPGPSASTSMLPSYDDAVAERPYQGQPLSPSLPQPTYNTMQDNQSQFRAPNSRSEYMGDPESQPLLASTNARRNDTHNGEGDGDRSWRDQCRTYWQMWRKRNRHNRWIRKVLLILLCVSVIAAVIMLLATVPRDYSDAPVEIPEFPEIRNPYHREAAHAAVKYCKSSSVLTTNSSMSWEFPDTKDVEFTQTSVAAFAIQNLLRNGRWGDVSSEKPTEAAQPGSNMVQRNQDIRHRGDVLIKRRESGQGVKVEVGAFYSHHFLSRLTGFVAEGSSILLQVPQSTYGHYSDEGELCIYTFTIIEVEPEYNLTNLWVDTEVMAVTIDGSLDLGADSEKMVIKSLVDKIDFKGPNHGESVLRSRDITVETQTGAIVGTYPLLDNLSLSSKTGLIDVDIAPQEADPRHEKPARLSVESTTGDIVVRTIDLNYTFDDALASSQRSWPPKRNYQTGIISLTGTLDLHLLSGKATSISCNTGQITAVVVPCDDPNKKSTLDIVSNTGDVRLDIANSIYSDKAVLTKLDASVKVRTGSQTIGVPSRWEGRWEGRSLGGIFHVPVSGFIADRSGAEPSYPLWFRVFGHRGHGDSLVRSEEVSGATKWVDSGS